MEINFNTDKLVILNYPKGAGGKFLSLCLNLHDSVLPQHEKLARLKMKSSQRIKLSLALAMNLFERTKENGSHNELGCMELANFNSQDLLIDSRHDERKSNQFWRELTNLNDMFYFMVDHGDGLVYSRYVNRRTIRLKNYGWIMESRGLETSKAKDKYQLENMTHFDMESIKSEHKFISEIDRVFVFLGLQFKHHGELEQLRQSFMETHKIGFGAGGKL